MPPAARKTDMHTCPMVTGTVPHVGGPISGPCSPDVNIGGLPAARVTDKAACAGPPDTIVKGALTVKINNLAAARITDTTAHGGVIVGGCPTVIIGDIGMFLYSPGITIQGTKQYIDKVRARLDALKLAPSGKAILDRLDANAQKGKHVIVVPTGPGSNGCTPGTQAAFPKKTKVDAATGKVQVIDPGDGTDSSVDFDPDYEPKYPDGTSCRSPEIGLGHELIHAVHNGDGTNLRKFPDLTDPLLAVSNHEEAQTIGRGAYVGTSPTDNSLRAELGFKARNSHGSVCP
jgi:uncharacterized Zn-binding protein involved in type VI secretion